MTAGETPRRKQHGVKREQGGITEGAFVLPDLAPRIGVGAGLGDGGIISTQADSCLRN